MSVHNRPPASHDPLDRAIDALLSTPRSDGPAEELIDLAVQSVHERQDQLKATAPRGPRNRRAARLVGFGALATAATLLFAVMHWGIGGRTAEALDKAIERVRSAQSVRFRVLDQVKPQAAPPDGSPEVPEWLRRTIASAHSRPPSDVMISGRKFRIDDVLGPGSTWTIDWDRKQALIIDSEHRAFQKTDMQQIAVSPLDIESMNVCDELLALRRQTARFEGAGVVDGQKADRYVVRNGKAFHTEGDWTIWLGHDTGLPVKVTVDFDLRGVVISRVYDRFDWAPDLAPALFSLDPPDGFHQQSILHPLKVTPQPDEEQPEAKRPHAPRTAVAPSSE